MRVRDHNYSPYLHQCGQRKSIPQTVTVLHFNREYYLYCFDGGHICKLSRKPASIKQECECEPRNPYVQGVRVQFLQGLFRNIWHCTAGLIICAYLTIKLNWASPEPAAFISGNGVIPTPGGRRPQPKICLLFPSGPHQGLPRSLCLSRV